MLKRIWFTVKPLVGIIAAIAYVALAAVTWGFIGFVLSIFVPAWGCILIVVFTEFVSCMRGRWKQSAALAEREGE